MALKNIWKDLVENESDISADLFDRVFMIIIAFYFGTQSEKQNIEHK